jgi:hypothetical protein
MAASIFIGSEHLIRLLIASQRVYALKGMYSPEDSLYITFYAMSIKNIQKFTDNLFKIQYLIILNPWQRRKKISLSLQDVIRYNVAICNIWSRNMDIFWVYIFVYFVQTSNVHFQFYGAD